MTKQRLIALALALLMPMTAYGASSSKPTCQQVIKAADLAIAGQKKEIQIRDLRIKDDADQISALQSDVVSMAKKAAEPAAWYKSPFLWFVLGVGTAAYLVRK